MSWQTDKLSRSRAALPVVAFAGVLASAAVSFTVSHGVIRAGLAAVFIVFIGVGELLRISLPGQRDAAPLGVAAAIAYALLPVTNGSTVWFGIPQTVTVVTIGTLAGAAPRALAGRPVSVDDLARRVISVTVAAVIFRPILGTGVFDQGHPTWQLAATMTGAAIAAATVDALIAAAIRAAGDHAPLGTSIIDELRALVGISTAISATGVLIALAYPLMGVWAIPVFATPLLLTQFSFRRYATIRATYLQTIRALSRVTEVGGQTETGHSRRVGRLAVMVGRELGLSERVILDLEYASLMHDIGQLSLPTPIPGGATTMVSHADQMRIASLGAAVIRQSGALERAAVIVERQADSHRSDGGEPDPTLPVESRIIRVCNAYDDLVGSSVEVARKLQAVERLQLSTAREFDPRVVDVLTRIVERQLAYVN
jgi:hypothetical protein